MLTSLALTFRDALEGRSGHAITAFYVIAIVLIVPVVMIVQSLYGLYAAGASAVALVTCLLCLELLLVQLYGRKRILPEFAPVAQAANDSLDQQRGFLHDAWSIT